MFFRKKKNTDASRIAMMNSNISEEYVEENISKIKEEDVEVVMDNEESISHKLSNATPLRKFAEIGKIMFAMLKDIKNGRYPEVPWFTIAAIFIGFIICFKSIRRDSSLYTWIWLYR